MKAILPAILFTALSTASALAQTSYYNQQPGFLNANKTWAFSHQAGLDFNSGTAVAIQTAIPSLPNRQGEGTSAVSDPQTGALLFYTDGAQCWNASGQVMPNGDSLLGNSGNYWSGNTGTFMTTTQGSCIVPVPGEVDKYYLFSMNYQGEVGPSGSLFYNVVDMSLENGSGNIVAGQKNILLDSTSLSEAMIAIPGNNCDAWLMVHASALDTGNNANKSYRAYHITANGVDPNPVISYGKTHSWTGSMSVSPGRDRIALVGLLPQLVVNGVRLGGVEVVKFDPNTGMVSEPIEIFSDGQGSHSCAFSPDNTKLYIDHSEPTTGTQLVQFTISTFDSLAIDTSRKIISPIPTSFSAGLRLFNDTIYVAGFGTSSLGTINQPNNSGTACDYQSGAISLLAGTSSAMACLPTEVIIPGSPDTSHSLVLDTLICSGWPAGFTLSPTAVYADYTYEWQDQSTDTFLTVSEEGMYWVRYTNGCHTFIDSFILSGSELIPPVIRVDEFELSTTVAYASYQWLLNGTLLTGETNSTLNVLENGDYQVIVTNAAGCVDTSDVYEVTNVGIRAVHPMASKISVYPNPAKDIVYIQAPVPVSLRLLSIEGRLLRSSDKASQLTLANLQRGIYLLQVSDEKGALIKTVKLIKNP